MTSDTDTGLVDEIDKAAARGHSLQLNCDQVRELAAALSRPSDFASGVEALTKARDTFRQYAQIHAAKATADGEVKALHNATLAAEMELALLAITPPTATGED